MCYKYLQHRIMRAKEARNAAAAPLDGQSRNCKVRLLAPADNDEFVQAVTEV